jgi:hypothetical protein
MCHSEHLTCTTDPKSFPNRHGCDQEASDGASPVENGTRLASFHSLRMDGLVYPDRSWSQGNPVETLLPRLVACTRETWGASHLAVIATCPGPTVLPAPFRLLNHPGISLGVLWWR